MNADQIRSHGQGLRTGIVSGVFGSTILYLIFVGMMWNGGCFEEPAAQQPTEAPALLRVKVISNTTYTVVETPDGQRLKLENYPFGFADEVVGREFLVRRASLPEEYKPFTVAELESLAEWDRVREMTAGIQLGDAPVITFPSPTPVDVAALIAKWDDLVAAIPAPAEPPALVTVTSDPPALIATTDTFPNDEWIELYYRLSQALPAVDAYEQIDLNHMRTSYQMWKEDGNMASRSGLIDDLRKWKSDQGDWAIHGCGLWALSGGVDEETRDKMVAAFQRWQSIPGGKARLEAKLELVEMYKAAIEGHEEE